MTDTKTIPVENVRKERQMAPKTPTYSVEDGEYDYTVIDIPVAHCLQHGQDCEHAKAVEEFKKPKHLRKGA